MQQRNNFDKFCQSQLTKIVDYSTVALIPSITCHYKTVNSTPCMTVKILLDLIAVYRTLRTIRYDTRCYFNVRSKADISQLNLPHGNDN